MENSPLPEIPMWTTYAPDDSDLSRKILIIRGLISGYRSESPSDEEKGYYKALDTVKKILDETE